MIGVAQFDRLYAGSDDPWGFRDRWYERRKRALVLASLPRRRHARAWEAGCANGELTARLAQRCDRVVATDAAARAVELARQRVRALPNVDVRQLALPARPDGRFDLVVFCEVGYYFDAPELRACAERLHASLDEDATLIACHWRHRSPDHVQGGDDVHALLDAALPLSRLARHVEDDFVLDVWARDRRSVAEREGLVSRSGGDR